MNEKSIALLKIIEAFHGGSLNIDLQCVTLRTGSSTFTTDRGLLSLNESGNPQITVYNLQGGDPYSDAMRLTLHDDDLEVNCLLADGLSCYMVRLGNGGLQFGDGNAKFWFSPDEIKISSNTDGLENVHTITGSVKKYHFGFNTNQELVPLDYYKAKKNHLPYDNIILKISEGATYRDQTIPGTEVRLFRLEDTNLKLSESEAILHSESLLYALQFIGCQKLKWQSLLLENDEHASVHLYKSYPNFSGCYNPLFPHNNDKEIYDLLAATILAFSAKLDDYYKSALDVYLTHTEVTDTNIEIFMMATAIESVIYKWKGIGHRNFYKNAVKVCPVLTKITESDHWIPYRHQPAHGTFQYIRRADIQKQKEMDIAVLKFATIFNDIMAEWIGYQGEVTDYTQPGWERMFTRN